MTEAEQILREWAERVLKDVPLTDSWRYTWERTGKLVCAACGGPIYVDNASGYYMHCPTIDSHGISRMPDGMNGYHCGPLFAGPTAFPDKRMDNETIASYVLAVLNQ